MVSETSEWKFDKKYGYLRSQNIFQREIYSLQRINSNFIVKKPGTHYFVLNVNLHSDRKNGHNLPPNMMH